MNKLYTDKDIKKYFESILYRALNSGWVNQPSFRYSIEYTSNTNCLSGKLKILGKGKVTGDVTTLVDASFDSLSSRIEVDDWVAEKLSMMLMSHCAWPK